MIYIKMHGRLGNQFFQYAYARILAKKRQDTIAIDFTNIESESVSDPRGGWENSLRYYHIEPHTSIGRVHYTLGQRLAVQFRKHGFRIYRQFNKNIDNKNVFDEKIIDFLENKGIWIANGYHAYKNLPKGNLILDGYFESPKYFVDYADIIREEFVPKNTVSEENLDLLNLIYDSESVCVTIRRGDFVYKEGVAKSANICTPDYFYKGIAYILQQIPKARFVVFSDDIPWVQENMKFPEATLFESGQNPVWEKMLLMSACKHFIISNSTFSWWAQYLSSNPDKLVVAPERWRREGMTGKDLYDERWILIPVG